MSNNAYTEDSYEHGLIELFQDMDYEHVYGPDLERDYHSPLCLDELEDSIRRINSDQSEDAIEEALNKLKDFENADLVSKNEVFMNYLQNGVEVSYWDKGETRSTRIALADYQNIDNNSFVIANQWTIIENSEKRPDMIVFLNGLPIVLIELKSPTREETDASEGYKQIRNYMHEIPSAFIYNAFCVMSDLTQTKAGTITSDESRFMEWKSEDGSYEYTQYATFETFFRGIFHKERLLDLIKNFICFSDTGTEKIKIMAAYHQYFAVRKAIESTRKATQTDGKAGVMWHTQGSGKSLSMVFYAHLLMEALDSPTIVVMTDRNDLDGQLFSQFQKCAAFLRQKPVQATSRDDLRQLLEGRKANGIFFSTMQKFDDWEKSLSERRNIVVMADEAHRSQYGLAEKVKLVDDGQGNQVAKTMIGAARKVRNGLPNATYIGFTGTPLSTEDKSTREVFGDYIDIYDMTQAVEDGATRPVYYESRVINLKLDEEILQKIDAEYDRLAEQADEEVINKSKQVLGKMDAILGHPETINSLVDDILNHYEENRENYLTGKAMIVAYSRQIAMAIYDKILEKRSDWQDKVAVVMTESNQDPEEWRTIIGNKRHKDELAARFKDDCDPLKIAIVVDMWLTGFDVPSLATMYVYKPMKSHNLMQAIARVNRVFRDKEGGLVVDYIGIAQALKDAMNDYTARDRDKYGDMDIAETAYPKFLEQLDLCRDQLYGFDYKGFFGDSKLRQAQLITGAINFLCDSARSKEKEDFMQEALKLQKAKSLCSSLLDERERLESAFFEAVRVALVRIQNQGSGRKFSLKEINDSINALLKQSVKSEGVINLFSDVEEEFSLFDPAFLEEISRMKEKNLAVEVLRRLLTDEIRGYKRTNIVKSQKFSEMLQRTLNAYINGLLTNEQVIEELMKMAEAIKKAHEAGADMGLTAEELAFYDALTKPAAIKDIYTNDQLISLTRELTEMLRRNKTIDWKERESARSRMKMMIKRLLAKWKYPPKGMDDALDTVMTQCELWTDNAFL